MGKVIIGLWFLILTSCQYMGNVKECPNESFQRDIPIKNQDSSYIKEKDKIYRMLDLYSLENGFNQMEIRIWFGYNSTIEHLFIFKQKQNTWDGELWMTQYQYGGKMHTLISVDADKKKISPKCGWTKFVDSLYNYGLLTLPDCDNIKGYESNYEFMGFVVEFANCAMYRSYLYRDPWTKVDRFKEAMQVKLITDLIERQLCLRD